MFTTNVDKNQFGFGGLVFFLSSVSGFVIVTKNLEVKLNTAHKIKVII